MQRILVAVLLVSVGVLAGCATRPFDARGDGARVVERLWQAGCEPKAYSQGRHGEIQIICK